MSGENQKQEIIEWILLNKEIASHVFHGNQHTGSIGGNDLPPRQVDPNRFQVPANRNKVSTTVRRNALVARMKDLAVTKEQSGHDFRGNQYTGGKGGDGQEPRQSDPNRYQAPEDRNEVSTTSSLKPANFKGIIDEVNKNDGATISMIGAELPKDGYFCALGNPHASQMSIDDFENRDQAIQAVSDFIEKNASELGKDGNYLGIFKDESTGTVDFDISQHIPKLEDAISAGASRDQKSIWDIANSDVIGTGGSGKLDKHLKRSALVTKAKNNPLYLAQLPKDIESMTKEQILEVATRIVDSISPKTDTESK